MIKTTYIPIKSYLFKGYFITNIIYGIIRICCCYCKISITRIYYYTISCIYYSYQSWCTHCIRNLPVISTQSSIANRVTLNNSIPCRTIVNTVIKIKSVRSPYNIPLNLSGSSSNTRYMSCKTFVIISLCNYGKSSWRMAWDVSVIEIPRVSGIIKILNVTTRRRRSIINS